MKNAPVGLSHGAGDLMQSPLTAICFSKQANMKKIAQVICVVFIAAVMIVGGRWYMYVAYAESPYDEVGIGLNGYAPEPLRIWGCRKMQQRFARQLPPYGCAGADGRNWL